MSTSENSLHINFPNSKGLVLEKALSGKQTYSSPAIPVASSRASDDYSFIDKDNNFSANQSSNPNASTSHSSFQHVDQSPALNSFSSIDSQTTNQLTNSQPPKKPSPLLPVQSSYDNQSHHGSSVQPYPQSESERSPQQLQESTANAINRSSNPPITPQITTTHTPHRAVHRSPPEGSNNYPINHSTSHYVGQINTPTTFTSPIAPTQQKSYNQHVVSYSNPGLTVAVNATPVLAHSDNFNQPHSSPFSSLITPNLGFDPTSLTFHLATPYASGLEHELDRDAQQLQLSTHSDQNTSFPPNRAQRTYQGPWVAPKLLTRQVDDDYRQNDLTSAEILSSSNQTALQPTHHPPSRPHAPVSLISPVNALKPQGLSITLNPGQNSPYQSSITLNQLPNDDDDDADADMDDGDDEIWNSELQSTSNNTKIIPKAQLPPLFANQCSTSRTHLGRLPSDSSDFHDISQMTSCAHNTSLHSPNPFNLSQFSHTSPPTPTIHINNAKLTKNELETKRIQQNLATLSSPFNTSNYSQPVGIKLMSPRTGNVSTPQKTPKLTNQSPFQHFSTLPTPHPGQSEMSHAQVYTKQHSSECAQLNQFSQHQTSAPSNSHNNPATPSISSRLHLPNPTNAPSTPSRNLQTPIPPTPGRVHLNHNALRQIPSTPSRFPLSPSVHPPPAQSLLSLRLPPSTLDKVDNSAQDPSIHANNQPLLSSRQVAVLQPMSPTKSIITLSHSSFTTNTSSTNNPTTPVLTPSLSHSLNGVGNGNDAVNTTNSIIIPPSPLPTSSLITTPSSRLPAHILPSTRHLGAFSPTSNLERNIRRYRDQQLINTSVQNSLTTPLALINRADNSGTNSQSGSLPCPFSPTTTSLHDNNSGKQSHIQQQQQQQQQRDAVKPQKPQQEHQQMAFKKPIVQVDPSSLQTTTYPRSLSPVDNTPKNTKFNFDMKLPGEAQTQNQIIHPHFHQSLPLFSKQPSAASSLANSTSSATTNSTISSSTNTPNSKTTTFQKPEPKPNAGNTKPAKAIILDVVYKSRLQAPSNNTRDRTPCSSKQRPKGWDQSLQKPPHKSTPNSINALGRPELSHGSSTTSFRSIGSIAQSRNTNGDETARGVDNNQELVNQLNAITLDDLGLDVMGNQQDHMHSTRNHQINQNGSQQHPHSAMDRYNLPTYNRLCSAPASAPISSHYKPDQNLFTNTFLNAGVNQTQNVSLDRTDCDRESSNNSSTQPSPTPHFKSTPSHLRRLDTAPISKFTLNATVQFDQLDQVENSDTVCYDEDGEMIFRRMPAPSVFKPSKNRFSRASLPFQPRQNDNEAVSSSTSSYLPSQQQIQPQQREPYNSTTDLFLPDHQSQLPPTLALETVNTQNPFLSNQMSTEPLPAFHSLNSTLASMISQPRVNCSENDTTSETPSSITFHPNSHFNTQFSPHTAQTSASTSTSPTTTTTTTITSTVSTTHITNSVPIQIQSNSEKLFNLTSLCHSTNENPHTSSIPVMYQSNEYKVAKHIAGMTGDASIIHSLPLSAHYRYTSHRNPLPYLIGNHYVYNTVYNTIPKAKFDAQGKLILTKKQRKFYKHLFNNHSSGQDQDITSRYEDKIVWGETVTVSPSNPKSKKYSDSSMTRLTADSLDSIHGQVNGQVIDKDEIASIGPNTIISLSNLHLFCGMTNDDVNNLTAALSHSDMTKTQRKHHDNSNATSPPNLSPTHQQPAPPPFDSCAVARTKTRVWHTSKKKLDTDYSGNVPEFDQSDQLIGSHRYTRSPSANAAVNNVQWTSQPYPQTDLKTHSIVMKWRGVVVDDDEDEDEDEDEGLGNFMSLLDQVEEEYNSTPPRFLQSAQNQSLQSPTPQPTPQKPTPTQVPETPFISTRKKTNQPPRVAVAGSTPNPHSTIRPLSPNAATSQEEPDTPCSFPELNLPLPFTDILPSYRPILHTEQHDDITADQQLNKSGEIAKVGHFSSWSSSIKTPLSMNDNTDDEDGDGTSDECDGDIPLHLRSNPDFDPIMKRLKPSALNTLVSKVASHRNNSGPSFDVALPGQNPTFTPFQSISSSQPITTPQSLASLPQPRVVKPYGVESNTTHLLYQISGKTLLPNPSKLSSFNVLFAHQLDHLGISHHTPSHAQVVSLNTKNLLSQHKIPLLNQSVYSSVLSNKPVHVSKRRHFQTTPLATLEAPDVNNDYYLNLLDWGKSGHIALILSQTIYLYDPKTEEVVECGQTQGLLYPTVVKFSPSGSRFAVGISDGAILIYTVSQFLSPSFIPAVLNSGDNPCESSYEYHSKRVDCIEWISEDEIISGGADQRVIHVDLRCIYAGGVTDIGRECIGEVMSLAFNSHTKQLALGTNDSVCQIFDLRSNPILPQFDIIDHHAAVKTLQWSPHNPALLATGSGTLDRHLRLYDISQGRLLAAQNTNNQISSVQWSYYSNEIVTTHGFSNNAIMFWDATTLESLGQVGGHSGRILTAAVNPSKTCLITISADETTRIWDLYQHERREIVKGLKSTQFASLSTPLSSDQSPHQHGFVDELFRDDEFVIKHRTARDLHQQENDAGVDSEFEFHNQTSHQLNPNYQREMLVLDHLSASLGFLPTTPQRNTSNGAHPVAANKIETKQEMELQQHRTTRSNSNTPRKNVNRTPSKLKNNHKLR